MKQKNVVNHKNPKGRSVVRENEPNDYYSYNPSWSFSQSDNKLWTFTKESLGDLFWDEVFPFLKNLEGKTWAEIFQEGKKQNHSINVEKLSKVARDRLIERELDIDELISLRLTGTHRIYGYIVKRVFIILWFDKDHGDNDTCVCRSRKSHT